MSYCILDDQDVLLLADMAELITTAEGCFVAKAMGHLIAPPRHRVAFDNGELVFTIGGVSAGSGSAGLAGFRAYETFAGHGTNRAQVVAVWSTSNGNLEGLIVGDALGALRTGALGGVAIKYMSPEDAGICAIVGSGRQAETQVMAAAAVRPSLRLIRVFSRNRENRERFAARMSEKLRVPVVSAATVRDAVADADLVLCATDSSVPVLDIAWLKRGVHVNTIGPKWAREHELPTDIGDRSAVIATDAPEQVRSSQRAFFLRGTAAWMRIVDLAEIVSGRAPARRSKEEQTLFCSAGLAGTEVAIASTILQRAQKMQASAQPTT